MIRGVHRPRRVVRQLEGARRGFGCLGVLCSCAALAAAGCSGAKTGETGGDGPSSTDRSPTDSGASDTSIAGNATSSMAVSISDGSVPNDRDGGIGPPASANIVVDQFGYRTGDPKVAIVRNPITGFDSSPFTPGTTYALVDAATGAIVSHGAPAAWNGGATDPSSGDATWSFDFSSVTATGSYYVLDELHQVRSATFQIADTV